MNRVVEFLQQSATFYVATADGDQPRVRPFGAVANIDGRICLATSNRKAVYRQLLKNPKIEISATHPDQRWIRVTAEAAVDDSLATKEKMLALNPILTTMYSIDDGIFITVVLKNGTARVESFSGVEEMIEF